MERYPGDPFPHCDTEPVMVYALMFCEWESSSRLEMHGFLFADTCCAGPHS